MSAAVQIVIDWASPLFRSSDPATSRDAADAIRPHRQRVMDLVLAEYRARGPMTAKECEDVFACMGFGFSTVRKRVSELAALGLLVATGVVRDRSTVYALAVEP